MIGTIFILIGTLFILLVPINDYLIKRRSMNQLTVSATEIEENDRLDAEFDFDSVEEISLFDVLQVNWQNKNLPVIGQIHIPDLNLHLPILKGMQESNLLVGAGTVKEEQKMGEANYSLISHNTRNPSLLFAPLHRAEEGMKIYITDMKEVFVYSITVHEIIEPTRIDVLEDLPNQTILTLITCNYNGEKRLLTQADFVEKGSIKDYKTVF